MMRHLRKHHKKALENAEAESKRKDGQCSIIKAFEGQKPYSINHWKRKEYNLTLVFYIVKDLRPISVVENEGFRFLIAKLDRRYIMPTRKTVTEVLIPDIFRKVCQLVTEEFKDVSYFAITTLLK